MSTTSEAVIEHFYKTAGKSCLRATEGLNVVKLEWKLAFISITLVLWIRWAFELNSIKTNTLSENHSHHVTCSFWTRWSWWLLYNKETSGLPPKNAGTAEYNCSFLSRPNQQTISHKVTKRRSNNRICFLSNKILKPFLFKDELVLMWWFKGIEYWILNEVQGSRSVDMFICMALRDELYMRLTVWVLLACDFSTVALFCHVCRHTSPHTFTFVRIPGPLL